MHALPTPCCVCAGVGVYLQYEGDTAHDNIAKWNVKPLLVSRTKRYLDAGVTNQFWVLVDQHIHTRALRLLPGGAAGGGATPLPATASGGGGGGR